MRCERRVKRGVDAEIFADELLLGIFVEEVVFDHVDEIGSFAAGDRGADDFQRGALGVLDVGFGDVLVIEHLRQDAVARLIAALGMAVGGGVIVGSADDAGEVGVFGERKLAQIFAEVGDAGFGKAANAEAAAIAEVNLVGVELKNLLFVEALLELHRDHQLGEFAAPGALVGEEKRARDLHRDRAGALVVVAGVAEVGPGRADDADEVEAAVFEEALVFGGDDRVDQVGRDVVVADRAALFASESKRLVMSSGSMSAVTRSLPPPSGRIELIFLPPKVTEIALDGGEIGKLRRGDVDAVASHGELAERVVVFFGAVADLGQIGGRVRRLTRLRRRRCVAARRKFAWCFAADGRKGAHRSSANTSRRNR